MSIEQAGLIPNRSRDRRRPDTRWLGRAIAFALVTVGLAGPVMTAGAATANATPAAHGGKRSPAVALLPFGGDVFTVADNGVLIAVDLRTTPPGAPSYNLAGNPLGTTWGRFSSASATSGAKTVTTRTGDATDFRITLSGLFPNGVYSLFYRTFGPDSTNPVCGSEAALTALTARHPATQRPDASSFAADGTGAASFHGRVAGRLLDARSLQMTVLYHSMVRCMGRCRPEETR